MKLIKKLLSSVTAIACSVSVMCGSSAILTVGADNTYGVLTYDIFKTNIYEPYEYVKITDCDESAVSVNIPAEINGLPVVSIYFEAFQDCTSLESVTIPDSVTDIRDYAFCGCTSLKSITIPDGVKSIHYDTFRNCTSLESVTIPDSVTSIYTFAFYNCTNLKSITIPDSVTSIGDRVFFNTALVNDQTGLKYVDNWIVGCDLDVTSVEIKADTRGIAENAFLCSRIKSITIPDSITNIDYRVFCSSQSLESITIPDSVTNIDYQAFTHCASLESITILNPDCKIAMANDTICNGNYTISNGSDMYYKFYYKGIIYGYADSTAQAYADEYNYKFLAINDYGVLGDADGDEKVTAKDASLMFSEFKRIYNSEPSAFTEKQMKRCDFNGDGKITAIDASKAFSIYKKNYRRG